MFTSRIYHFLVYATLTLPPLCWLQPAPTLKEEFLEEGAKESISNVGIVFMAEVCGLLLF